MDLITNFTNNLTQIDIFLLSIIVAMSLFSSIKGIAKNIASLLLLMFSMMFAGTLAIKLQSKLIGYINAPHLAYMASFMIVLIGSYLIINIMIKTFIRRVKPKKIILNMIIAFGVALARYTLIASLLFSSLNSFSMVKKTTFWQNSYLKPYLINIGSHVYKNKNIVNNYTSKENIENYLSKKIERLQLDI